MHNSSARFLILPEYRNALQHDAAHATDFVLIQDQCCHSCYSMRLKLEVIKIYTKSTNPSLYKCQITFTELASCPVLNVPLGINEFSTPYTLPLLLNLSSDLTKSWHNVSPE